MKLIHHGVTLELAADDPRVAVIETLIYGRPLPPFLTPPAPPSPVEAPPAAVTIPEVWWLFWARLTPVARQWLARLTTGPVPARVARKEVGKLLALHRHISARAQAAGIHMPIVAKGREALRRYLVTEKARPILAQLAQNAGGTSGSIAHDEPNST